MTITNLDSVLAQLDRLSDGMQSGVTAATEAEAAKVLARAKELCPVGKGPNAGKLRDSGHIVRTTDGQLEIIFDAVDERGEGYALKVHERLDVHHDDGQAKFLETATNEAVPGFGQRVGGAAFQVAKNRAGV